MLGDILGGALQIGGLIAAPFTGGGSLAATAAGSAIGGSKNTPIGLGSWKGFSRGWGLNYGGG